MHTPKSVAPRRQQRRHTHSFADELQELASAGIANVDPSAQFPDHAAIPRQLRRDIRQECEAPAETATQRRTRLQGQEHDTLAIVPTRRGQRSAEQQGDLKES